MNFVGIQMSKLLYTKLLFENTPCCTLWAIQKVVLPDCPLGATANVVDKWNMA